jgi:FMN phosphatase YigB (HAD superfamily)
VDWLSSGDRKLVSVDVFDTVLLRGRESERRRFGWIAKATAKALEGAGHRRKTAHVLAARLDAQTAAYGAMRVTGDLGDVKLADIHRLQLLALGLPENLAPRLREAELAVDGASLRPQSALVRRLEALRAEGGRVVAISDTYYTQQDLLRLLRAHGAERAFDAVYASADHGATKKSGRLFAIVAHAEGVEPQAIVHLGDDRIADLVMAASSGLSAKWSPRPLRIRLLRKIDAALWRAAPGLATWRAT